MWWLFKNTPWKQWACGRWGGHHYSTEMIRMEGSPTYVIDPVTNCEHCELPLPEEQFNRVVAELDQMDFEEDHW